MNENIKKALGLQRNGFIQEAILVFEKELKNNNTSNEIAEYYGAALVSVGRSNEAKVYLKKALEKSIEKPQVLNNLATANRNLFLYEEALLNVKSALKFKPKYRDAWINRGNLHGDLLQWEEAVMCYQNAIKLGDYELGPYLSLALAQLQSSQFEEAFDTFKTAEAKFNDIDAKIGQLMCLRAMEKHDEALRYIESLYTNFPNERYAFENVQTLWMAGKLDESKKLLDQSLQKYPNSDSLKNFESFYENEQI